MDVAILTVGDEILAGDTTNTNAAWLGRQLAERGASVRRVVVVPDDVETIAAAVRDLAGRYDAVLVTGGLGPTHDDVTMDGVAAAFDRPLVEHPDAAAWFAEHSDYSFSELTTGTAHLPEGARMLPNEVGVAPGAVVADTADDGGDSLGTVYVLPGVPSEMEAMFESIAGEFTGEKRHVETVFAAEPESALLDRIEEVRGRFDVQVGSYPGDGVRLKLSGTDPTVVREAAAWLREHVETGEDETV